MGKRESAKKYQKTKGRKGLWYSLTKQTTYWVMLIPPTLFFLAFCYLPMTGVYMAFTRYDYSLGIFKSPFVGWDNFKFLVGSGTKAGFWGSAIWTLTWKTILYNIAFIGLGHLFQVTTAVILKELPSKKFRKISQTLMFLPYFISMVIVGVIAYNLFGSNGTVNTLIQWLGRERVMFYQEAGYWPWIIIAFNVWKGLGYGTVVYFATLAGIDESYYEAAAIDGAGLMQRIRYITLPMLKPTVIILVLFSLGGILKGQFELFYQLIGNNNLLFATTDIIDTYVYRMLTVSNNFGNGSAMGFYQSVFGLVTVLAVNSIVKKVEPGYELF